jgi:hypothetical protein
MTLPVSVRAGEIRSCLYRRLFLIPAARKTCRKHNNWMSRPGMEFTQNRKFPNKINTPQKNSSSSPKPHPYFAQERRAQ